MCRNFFKKSDSRLLMSFSQNCVFAHENAFFSVMDWPNCFIFGIDYSHIVLIIAIWPGDRIRRPEHSTVEHGSCDESV